MKHSSAYCGADAVASAKVRSRGGFTLVELLVVIGIIAVLISLLMPALSRAQQQARMIACASNMRQLGNYVFLYANDNRGSLPPDIVAENDNGSGAPFGAGKILTTSPYDLWTLLYNYGLSPASSVAVCPEVLADRFSGVDPNSHTTTAGYPNAVFSYAYNFYIGGMQLGGQPSGGAYQSNGNGYNIIPRCPGPIFLTSPAWAAQTNGGYWFSRPYKLSQIPNYAGTALFVEMDRVFVQPAYGGWENNVGISVNLEYQHSSIPNAYGAHQELNGLGLPHMASYNGQFMSNGLQYGDGRGNVLYCDGSVQNQVYHMGTYGTFDTPKNYIGWIEGTGVAPEYQP